MVGFERRFCWAVLITAYWFCALGIIFGMSPSEMADRIVSNSERGFTVTVNDIEHQESVAVPGKAVIKIFFRPSVNLSMAMTQVTAMCQTVLRGLPPGTTPPLVITYTASTTPIVQLGLSSKTIPEQQLFDLGNNFLRTQLTTVQGAATPYPYGGKPRQNPGGSQSRQTPELRSGAGGHCECGGGAKSDSAGGHNQNRADRIQRGDERHSRHHHRTEQSAGENHELVHPLTCAMWRMCGTDSCRKPILSGRMARAAY